MKLPWIPVLTSKAGLCLTPQNWHEAQIDAAVLYLDDLLFKPGLSLLNTTTYLGLYLNWSGKLIINASRLQAGKDGLITLISPYDGNKQSLTYKHLVTLIHRLEPNRVILPRGILRDFPSIWTDWPSQIIPYVPIDDIAMTPALHHHGVYFELSDKGVLDHHMISDYSHLPRYVFGSLDGATLGLLSNLGVDYIESDTPAQMGMDGLVYGEEGLIDIKLDVWALDFNRISAQCTCCTCSSRLTKAYLHHLYQHTPLLCQRFLIQHNANYGLDIIK